MTHTTEAATFVQWHETLHELGVSPLEGVSALDRCVSPREARAEAMQEGLQVLGLQSHSQSLGQIM